MRVNYNSPSAAASARIQLHQTHFGETDINCYFAQPVTPIGMYKKFKRSINLCTYMYT